MKLIIQFMAIHVCLCLCRSVYAMCVHEYARLLARYHSATSYRAWPLRQNSSQPSRHISLSLPWSAGQLMRAASQLSQDNQSRHSRSPDAASHLHLPPKALIKTTLGEIAQNQVNKAVSRALSTVYSVRSYCHNKQKSPKSTCSSCIPLVSLFCKC